MVEKKKHIFDERQERLIRGESDIEAMRVKL